MVGAMEAWNSSIDLIQQRKQKVELGSCRIDLIQQRKHRE